MKKAKEQGQRMLDPKSLTKWLALFVAAALAIAVGLFCFMRYVIFRSAPDDKLADVVSSTSTLLGVFTIGGAALIQLRKHIIFEEQSKLDRDGKMSDRLTRAIENLHNKDSLAVREGALFELKRLGLDFPREQENIVRILGPFIREEIENPLPPRFEKDFKWGEYLPRPNEDIFLAGEIVSLFFKQTGCRLILYHLKADKLDLVDLQLQGAELLFSHFNKAVLWRAQLQGTDLSTADIQDADLASAHLQRADIPTYQLKRAKNVELAHLDDDLRAEYDRRKAKQNIKNQEA